MIRDTRASIKRCLMFETHLLLMQSKISFLIRNVSTVNAIEDFLFDSKRIYC